MRDDAALELRAETERVLRPLADLAAPVAPGADPPWDQLVRIREHEVERAAHCGASLGYDGEFDGWRGSRVDDSAVRSSSVSGAAPRSTRAPSPSPSSTTPSARAATV